MRNMSLNDLPPVVCRKPVQHFVSQIESLTLDDITKLAAKMLKTPPTVAAWGDGEFLFCPSSWDLPLL
jgi:hypothetical protein